MADTNNYFDSVLPARVASDADFAGSINNVFQFEIEGAGTWHIGPGGVVAAGEHSDPECVIASDKEIFDEVLEDFSLAMGKFMAGKITATDLGLAMQLQQFLG